MLGVRTVPPIGPSVPREIRAAFGPKMSGDFFRNDAPELFFMLTGTSCFDIVNTNLEPIKGRIFLYDPGFLHAWKGWMHGLVFVRIEPVKCRV